MHDLAGLLAEARAHTNASTAPAYDIVLANGRVIDPETKLDAVRIIGIKGGTIAAVSTAELKCRIRFPV